MSSFSFYGDFLYVTKLKIVTPTNSFSNPSVLRLVFRIILLDPFTLQISPKLLESVQGS